MDNRVYFSDVSRSNAKRNVSSDYQFTPAKQIPSSKKVSVDKSARGAEIPSKKQLFAKFGSVADSLQNNQLVGENISSEGMRILVYPDDFLLTHQDQRILQHQLNQVIHCFRFSGWLINTQKFIMTPTRELEFLGLIRNTETNMMY